MVFFNLLTGALVSFLGQLPVGFINLSAVQIAVQQNQWKAMQFAFGVMIVEMLYLRIVLLLLNRILQNEQWVNYIQIVTIIVFVVLTIVGFIRYKKENAVEAKQPTEKNQVLNGMVLSALNFAQLPFWIIWSSYVITQKWVAQTNTAFNFFTIGTGAGTFIGIYLYILFGKRIISKIKNGRRYLQIAIAVFFLIAAIAQIIQLAGK
jgi:threonine/homoserine/homoserine lactone efflux protein